MPGPTTGSRSQKNELTGVASALVTTYDEANTLRYPLGRGALVTLSDTRELKIGDGTTPIAELPDHRHPNTYAPLGHHHIYGTNEPWLMANPKLWYRPDVVNHPELVILDGRDITTDQAERLSDIYPGVRLLTDPVENLSGQSFENDYITLTSNGGWKGVCHPACLFGEPMSIENIYKFSDQWLSSSTDLSAEHALTVSFKSGYRYRPTEYWVVPASGTVEASALRRPTPAAWVFEGSEDGNTWVVLDQHNAVPADFWSVFNTQFFEVTTNNAYRHLRLRITSWNAGETAGMEVGLRRFWIFGRKLGGFALPKLESPHPDFVWVVPMRNMGVALKHEDVGDIGYTALSADNMPGYRLHPQGQEVSKVQYPDLCAAIGHQFSPPMDGSWSASAGTISNGVWNTGITDSNMPAHLTFTPLLPLMLASYEFLFSSGDRVPLSWTIEGYFEETDTWDTIQTVVGLDEAAVRNAPSRTLIDVTAMESDYTYIRFNFTKWSEGSTPITFHVPTVTGHAAGMFHLPDVDDPADGTSYIVSSVRADDVASDIVQRLQQNQIRLAQVVTALQQQVNNIDANFNP